MTRFAITAPQILFSGKFIQKNAVIVEDGYIIGICPVGNVPKNLNIIETTGEYLLPGFIDIQVNGGGDVLFNDDPSTQSIESIGSAHRQYGTTGFFPTLISDDLDKVSVAIEAVDEAVKNKQAGVLGIHIEGPFLNKIKKGIHNDDKFKTLNNDTVDLLSSLKQGKIFVTLAPEMNDLNLIALLAKRGVVVAAGHTNATYEEIKNSLNYGVTAFTHLFNAMSPFEGRKPGVVGAAFDSDHTWATIIADGHHVHPASLRHAIKTKGINKMILVTDAMPTVGSKTKEFWLGQEYITAQNGVCTNKDGTLAGSDLDMCSAVKYTVNELGFDLAEASVMASLSPAALMGIDDELGSIDIGKKASLTLLNNELDVEGIWIEGVQY